MTANMPADTRLSVLVSQSPFLGLQPYSMGHAPLFGGREAASQAVIAQLDERAGQGRPFVAVTGISGSGKTSLLQAGVLPQLFSFSEHAYWRHARLRPTATDPLGELAAALLRALPELSETHSLNRDEFMQLLRENPATVSLLLQTSSQLIDHLHRLEHPDAPSLPCRVVLLIDPLEDLLSEDISAEQREYLLQALHALLDSGEVWIVAALRSEFLSYCDAYPALMRLLNDGGCYELPSPTEDELREMIARPAELAELQFAQNEQGQSLLDTIIHATAPTLPQLTPLGLSLSLLYQQRHDNTLTVSAWQAAPVSPHLIAQQAEAVYQQLPPDAQAATPELWRTLVNVEQGSLYVLRNASSRRLIRSEAHQQAADAFLQAGFLQRDREERLQLTHVCLVEQWTRAQQFLQETLALTTLEPETDSGSHLPSLPINHEQWLQRQQALVDSTHKLLSLVHHLLARWQPPPVVQRPRSRFWPVLALLSVGAAGYSLYHWQQLSTDYATQQTVIAESQHALVNSHQQVGTLAQRLGNYDAAVRAYQQAQTVLNSLPASRETQRAQAEVGLNLGLIQQQQGAWQAALQQFQQVQQQLQTLLQAQPQAVTLARLFIRSLQQEGALHAQLGQLSAAIAAYQSALQHAKTLAENDNSTVRLQANLHQALGEVFERLTQTEAALTQYSEAQRLFQQLAAHSSEQSQQDEADSYSQLAHIQFSLGNFSNAAEFYQQALQLRQQLLQQANPDNAQFAALADTYNALAAVKLAQNDTDAALEHYQRALSLWQRQAQQPDNLPALLALANTHDALGQVHYQREAWQSALEEYQEALSLRQSLAKRTQAVSPRVLALNYDQLAKVHLALNQPRSALSAYRQSFALTSQLASQDPQNLTMQRDLSISYEHLGDVQSRLDNQAAALTAYQASLALTRKLAEHSDNPQQLRDLAISYDNVAATHQALDDTEAALTHYQQALQLRQRLNQQHANLNLQDEVLFSLFKVGELQRELAQVTAARQTYQHALTLATQQVEAEPENGQAQAALTAIEQILAAL